MAEKLIDDFGKKIGGARKDYLDDAISACETETEKQQKAVQQFRQKKKKRGPNF